MKSIIKLILFYFTLNMFSQNSHKEIFDNYLDNFNSEGLSVMVVKGGNIIYKKNYGLSNREFKISVTDSTKFQIGSMTKQFTAMGIMILKDRGKLKLNDPVVKFLEDCPNSWKNLTIHQLLTHTSGLMHSWEHPEFRKIMANPITLDETINLFKKFPLKAETGSKWRYSGLGYFILAKIIELKSGMYWQDFLNTEIFEKLNMRNTGVTNHIDVVNNLASGYYKTRKGYKKAAHIYLPILTGGGDMYSTLDDLRKWDRALNDRKLISEESYKLLFTPEKRSYAYGWFVDRYKSHKRIHHSGGVPGFVSNIVRFPDDNLVVILLCNATTMSSSFLQEFPSLVFDKLIMN